MIFMSMVPKPEQYLAIAKLLREYSKDPEKKRQMMPLITQELHVSGRDVGKVTKMIDQGFIVYDKRDIPAYTEDMDVIELKMSKGRPPAIVSTDDAVVRTVQEEIRSESVTSTQQYLILGKAVWAAYTRWAARKGLSVEDIKKTPAHEVIIRALEKEAAYDRLEKTVRELQEDLNIALKEADPIQRLRQAGSLINRFTELALINEITEEALGVPLLNMEPLAKHYNNMINAYLTYGGI